VKIDIEQWHAELEERFKDDKYVSLSKDPSSFFDGFFCDGGFPISPDVYPIWHESGIILEDDSRPFFHFNIHTGQWDENTDQNFRLFWVNEEGVFGEIAVDSGKVTEFFKIESPGLVVEYINLLRNRKLGKQSKLIFKEESISPMIDGIYVRFFRYADDLTENFEELPWVNFQAIEEIVKFHLDNSVPWMAAPLAKIRQRQLQDKIKQ
jgi:hypothetical protein